MAEIVSPLLEWLNNHPQLAGLFTFVISAAESVAIIGTIVPGSIMMTAIGALAGAGVIPLWPTIFWAILGAIVGDGISYWIGHYFKSRLHRVWPFRTHPSLLKSGELFFHKYGSMSVFIGRFVGPVRALVPLVAGMLGMKPWKFTIANVLSAIGWAPVYMFPGILLGAASLELPPDIAMHVILVLLLIILFILLCLWFTYKLFQLIQHQTTQLQEKIWHYLTTSHYFSSVTYVLKHYDKTKKHGQLSLALLFVIVAITFCLLCLFVKLKTPINLIGNDIVFHLFRGLSIRSEVLNDMMINITLLGQKQVILPLIPVLFVWLLLFKRPRAACHALALGILASGGVFAIKHILKIPRPWGILHTPATYSMPSGHATLSAAIFIGLSLLIANAIPRGKRWPIYTICIGITALVGISRLYLGVHWLTDVISAWLFSAALLIAIVISYQRIYEKPISPFGILSVSLITIVICFSTYHHFYFAKLEKEYTQLNWPSKTMPLNTWWDKNEELPAYRASLFGFPSQLINIEWIGNLDKIRDTLVKQGWSRPPARDFISTLHRIADISSTEYLPLVSPQYLDKKPALILTRYVNGKNLIVIRLWNSNRIIKEGNQTVWVGILGIIPRSYSWLFTKHPGDLTIQTELVFPKPSTSQQWEWKIMHYNTPLNKNHTKFIRQRILLIKENSQQSK